MPGRDYTKWVPTRSIRIPDELWDAAKRVASDRGETITDVVIRALQRYVRAHPLEPDDR